MTTTLADQIQCKTVTEVRNVAVSFVGKLDSGELLTGSPTVTVVGGGLTVASEQVNTVALTIDGVSVGIGQAVQFSVSGGTAGTTYTVRIECGTDASPAQTLIVNICLAVVVDS